MSVYAMNDNGNVFKFRDASAVWDGLKVIKDVPVYAEEKAGKAETKKGKAENKSA